MTAAGRRALLDFRFHGNERNRVGRPALAVPGLAVVVAVVPAVVLAVVLAATSPGLADEIVKAGAAPATETIVMIRHGEKPEAGLGQLDCKGLNRALALPPVIEKLFGKPDAIFAPDPSAVKIDHGRAYDYVRPLATIEPSAIAFGLPVSASIGLADLRRLQAALERPALHDGVVVVAWEHRYIEKLARTLMAAHRGNAAAVPVWQGEDFDSIYVVTLNWSGPRATAAFQRKAEGLDGQSDACPH
jgi:hypothetical protein